MEHKWLTRLYRLLAFALILLVAFSIMYTAALFTPGIDGDTTGQKNCPSAFSNPTPTSTKQLNDDIAFANKKASDDLSHIDDDTDALHKITDPVKKAIFLRQILFGLLSHDIDRYENKRVDRANVGTHLILCAYDRSYIDTKALAKKSAQDYKTWMKATHDKTIASVMSSYQDDRDPTLRFLTLGNIFILWLFVIALGTGMFFLRKHIGPIKHVNKIVRIVSAALVFLFFGLITAGTLVHVHSDYDDNNKSCKISDAFVIAHGTNDVEEQAMSIGYGSGRNALTESSQKAWGRLTSSPAIKNNNVTLTADQKREFFQANEAMRKRAVKMYSQFESTDFYKDALENSKIADGSCIRTARGSILISSFSLIVIIFFACFLKGRKPTLLEQNQTTQKSL